MHGADTESKKISCREAVRETGFTEVPIWGTPVILNVAGIKLIRARTKDQGTNCVQRPLVSTVRKKCIFYGRSSYNLYGLYLYAFVRQIKIN